MWSIDTLKLLICIISCVLICFSLSMIGYTVYAMSSFGSYSDLMLPEVNKCPTFALVMTSLTIVFIAVCLTGKILENRIVLYAGAVLMIVIFITHLVYMVVLLVLFNNPSKFLQSYKDLKIQSPPQGLINAQEDLDCCGYTGPENYENVHESCCESMQPDCNFTSDDFHREACIPKIIQILHNKANTMLVLCSLIVYIEIIFVIIIFILCDEMKKEDEEIAAELGEEFWIAQRESKKIITRRSRRSEDENHTRDRITKMSSMGSSASRNFREDPHTPANSMMGQDDRSSRDESLNVKKKRSNRKSTIKHPSMVSDRYDGRHSKSEGKDSVEKSLNLRKVSASQRLSYVGRSSIAERPSNMERINKEKPTRWWRKEGRLSQDKERPSTDDGKSKEERPSKIRRWSKERRSSKDNRKASKKNPSMDSTKKE